MTTRWVHREISNYQYLIYLNTIAGESLISLVTLTNAHPPQDGLTATSTNTLYFHGYLLTIPPKKLTLVTQASIETSPRYILIDPYPLTFEPFPLTANWSTERESIAFI